MAADDQVRRAKRLTIGAIYAVPFLAPPAARLHVIDAANLPHVKTLAVSLDKILAVNSEYVAQLTDAELVACLAHEFLHPALSHAQRQGSRVAMVLCKDGSQVPLWNVACDMAINQIVRGAGFRLPAGALFPPSGHEDESAEQLYDHLLQHGQRLPQHCQPRTGQVACGCGLEKPGALGKHPGEEGADGLKVDGEGEDGEGKQAGDSEGSLRREWQEVAAQVAALARGTGAGNGIIKALEAPPQPVRWDRVIWSAALHAQAAHGRDGQTWTRRNRRSPPGVVLPGWCAVRARAAAVIDASRSMTDEMIGEAVAQVVRIQAQTSGLKIYLVVHDDGVRWQGWVGARSVADIKRAVKCWGRGGTSFQAAYEAVEEAGRFDACVHLTDGEVGHWPDPPRTARRLVVARMRRGGDQAPRGAIEVFVEVKGGCT